MTSVSIPSFVICYGVIILTLGSCQHSQFPYSVNFGASNANKMNMSDKFVIHNPGDCPNHMTWYRHPRNENTWICDCTMGYVYISLTDSCYKPYSRGPCKLGEYIVFPPDAAVPKCEMNPCGREGFLPFKGSCYQMEAKEGPCGDDIFGVNETTFQLGCTPFDLVPFLIIDAPGKGDGCPRGSRRTSQGLCKVPL